MVWVQGSGFGAGLGFIDPRGNFHGCADGVSMGVIMNPDPQRDLEIRSPRTIWEII